MIYTDGLNIFRSSSLSVWPVCLVINGLEYSKRVLPRNILLAGLWFGRGKPQPNVFLRPLKDTMDRFTKTGATFKLSDNSEVLVKGKILCFTCDLPAKSKFLGFKQYNGSHGCSTCLAPGRTYVLGPRSRVHVYPYSQNIELRSHAQTKEFALEAAEKRKTNQEADVNGVKRLTWLFYLLPNIILCTAIDVMHGVFLGMCKLLIELWFSSKYSGCPWSLYHLTDAVEERLKSIKVPSYVHRFPRSLKDVGLWKASELKLFLMYYSIPVLQGILENEYFVHHCKLVSAIYLLSQDSISYAQVSAAREMLHSYVSDFPTLYSLRYLGMNVHQLLHLPDTVLNLGPLWAYSCFFLESLNGELTKLVHGTRHVALQLCTSASIFLQVPVLIEKLPENSATYKFCRMLFRKSKSVKITGQVGNKVFAVGTYGNGLREIRHSRALMREKNIQNYSSINIFYRLLKDSIMFSSTEYSRKSVKSESTYVSFLNDQTPCLGKVIRFLRCSNCTPRCEKICGNCPSFYYFIAEVYNRKLWVTHDIPDVRLAFMSSVEPSKNYVVLPVGLLQCLCFHLKIGENEFITLPINLKETE